MPKMRKTVTRAATTLALAGSLAVLVPGTAHAACVPWTDVIPYSAEYTSGSLNTTTGQLDWNWWGEGWAAADSCAGTLNVYVRVSDRSVVPAEALNTSGWVHVASEYNPDGGYYGYRGGGTNLSVTYRSSFTSLTMRGTLGQVTVETKLVFVADGGPTTTVCEGSMKTFTSTPTGPQYHGSAVPEPCTL